MPDFKSHPKSEEFRTALKKLERLVDELRSPRYRAWSANNCRPLISGILWAKPHPSVALSIEILEVNKLVERIASSKRVENALVNRIHKLVEGARRACNYLPRVYE